MFTNALATPHFQRGGVPSRPDVRPDIRHDDDPATLQVVDVGAEIPQAELAREALHTVTNPFPHRRDRLGAQVDGTVADEVGIEGGSEDLARR